MDESRLGTDLLVTRRWSLDGSLSLAAASGDLLTASGLDDLEQALWLRLTVRQGDLDHLGHPDYGSRLHLLIGRRLVPATMALARAYVYEALRRESRIRVLGVEVLPDPSSPGSLLLNIAVQPLGTAEPIRLTASLDLGPGGTPAEAINP